MNMNDWQDDLKSFFKAQKADSDQRRKDDEINSQVKKFYTSKVKPAFKELKKELERYGRDVQIAVGDRFATIEVNFEGRLELNYQVKVNQVCPYPEMYYQDESGNRIWTEGAFKEGVQKYSVSDLPREEIIKNFLREYKSRLWALHK
jgi:hypothetical protein